MVSVRYGGITYTGFERIDAAAAEINLPVTIYDAARMPRPCASPRCTSCLKRRPAARGGVTEFFGLSTSGDRTFTGR
jgi:hypothetical protein